MQPQSTHPLRGLLIAQFLGAFNNNAFKLMVALLAIKGVDQSDPNYGKLSQHNTTIAFVVFTLPFLMISLPAGALADRLSKRMVMMTMKSVEFLLLLVVTLILFQDPTSQTTLLVLLCFMGAQSACFSPAKYGILPELLPHDRLSTGNGLLELWTFVAIIAGTGAGGALLDTVGQKPGLAGIVLMTLAALGFAAAWTVPAVPPARSQGGLVDTVKGAWQAVRNERILKLSIIGLTVYWMLASLLGQDILVYSKEVLKQSDTWAAAPLVVFGLGVGVGSMIAGRMSAAKIEIGLIPLGAIGMGAGTLLLGILSFGAPGLIGTLVLMAPIGIASGFIVVPLDSLIQWWTPADRRGGVIALSNTFVFSGILAGSLGADLMAWAGLDSRGIIVGAAFITLAGTAWALWLLPEACLRLVLVILTHTFYRLRVRGIENVPLTGGAVIVPNHVSFVDGLFLVASIDRPIRMIVDASYFNQPLFRPLMKAMGAIPISASGGPRVILRALKDAGEYLDRGELVCIFPEGQLTRTGMLLPFRRGLERIVKGRKAVIIPAYMDHVWGSIFSREGGRYLTKLPKRIPYPVTLAYGAPLPPGTPIHDVRRAVHELSETAWQLRKYDSRPLHHAFIWMAQRGHRKLALADLSRPHVSCQKALAGAIALARALQPHWQCQERVGILLPPSVAGALVNLAATLSGRTSVNLNYTSGRAGMSSAAKQSGLQSVVTSRSFLEKAKLELPDGVMPIWTEDEAARIGRGTRLIAGCLAIFGPIRLIEKYCGATRRPTMDDIATIIFSSGSTGEPKGVQLTHFNITANVEAATQIFRIEPHDRLLGILPLFHSFGYMSLWFAVNQGIGIIFHPSPLDAGAIGELVQRYRVTVLLATPTFLQIYMRRCTPAQFGSLRIVLAGAEKLPERLAQAFEDTFGIRPLEGYGTTECAPVIAASALDFRAPGFYQPGSRRGFVGQPLPGVSVRIVDPDSFAQLPPMTPGMLLVKGPNVMNGYLGRDDLTSKVMRDGWYITGDIALLDEDGFLRITDRLSRFSKIGGEMVPHGKVEEALQEAAGAAEQAFAVTAVPDEKKGEKLAVLYTLKEEALGPILEKLSASGLPNLFIPRRDQFVYVEKLPVLGTGKLDLREVKRIALNALTVKT